MIEKAAKAGSLGYFLSEETHNRIMMGIDSLRFLEGLAAYACNAPTASSALDIKDLTGYLQLLLSHTYKPLKSLKFGRWGEVEQAGKAGRPAPLSSPEQQLIQRYRDMSRSDQECLMRVAAAMSATQKRPEAEL